MTNFIQTKSSLLKREIPEDFQVITYQAHKAKPKKPVEENVVKNSAQKQTELDMKKARHEIFKFGMSGFDPEKKEEAKVQLAIKLGAKPPKNKYKNYKVLQQEKKRQKINEIKRLEFQQLGKNQNGKSIVKSSFTKRKKAPQGLLNMYGRATIKEMTKNKK